MYEYRNFAVFVLLELISVAFVSAHKSEKYSFLGTSNYITGSIYTIISEVKDYRSLKRVNEQLLDENIALRKKLLQEEILSKSPHNIVINERYDLIPAKVINNSIATTKNYLTLDKGAIHGITPGMGVMCREGIVGRVKAVSEHFSTVISFLHTDILVSAKLNQSGVMGTVQWQGHDPFCAQILYVPRHVAIEPGEAVVTSGYNSTFFEGILIGHIKRVILRKEAPFYDIELNLSTDFSRLRYVYVVKDALKQEQNALEQHTKSFYE